MSDKTAIEWCDATWNPVVGCSIVSPGCTNCYAMKQAARIEIMDMGARATRDESLVIGGTHYAGTTKPSKAGAVWTGKVALASESVQLAPLRRRKPTVYFVNSMGDLFHESVPDAWIDRVVAVMALAPQHTFIVLTKRAKRMREYMANVEREAFWMSAVARFLTTIPGMMDRAHPILGRREPWLPLPHVVLGVSAEDQQRADERVPDLLATPAAGRFVSAEPLISGIDFRRWLATARVTCRACGTVFWLHEADPCTHYPTGWTLACPGCGNCRCTPKQEDRGDPVSWGPPNDWRPRDIGRFNRVHPRIKIKSGLDGIIVGGESGPGARPMHPDWARSIRDQCAAAQVPFFFKQWGEWAPRDACSDAWTSGEGGLQFDVCHMMSRAGDGSNNVHRVGKRRAGRLLDGREHNDLPWPRKDRS